MFLFQNKLAHGSFKDINNSLYVLESLLYLCKRIIYM